jgi:hypothetical protein
MDLTGMNKVLEIPPWWGYSSEHGWVVIDRMIPPNRSDRSQDFLFFRCRDSVTFFDRRSRWVAPRYIYASTYLSSLAPPESEQAALEYGTFKARWAEFEAEIRRQFEIIESDRQQAELERVRSEAVKMKKKPPKAKARKAEAESAGESQVEEYPAADSRGS